MKFHLSFLIFLMTIPAAAQQQSGTSWMNGMYLNVDSVYNNISFEEPGVMKQSGGIGGVRTEIGMPLFGIGYLSVGGSYFDGRLNYEGSTLNGTTINTITSDYLRDMRGMFHIGMNGFLLSVGYAERYWYDNLISSYRRRTEYKYNPIRATYFTGPYYYSFEYDRWIEGENTSHMADLGGGRHDVHMKQKTGKGMGLEFGRIIGGGASGARIFIAYHKWDVDASEAVSDGVSTLVEPKNTTKSLQAGVGFFF